MMHNKIRYFELLDELVALPNPLPLPGKRSLVTI
jgi:hypothetical protein